MNALAKRQRREEKMFDMMTQQEQSGISQIAFCKQQKMSIATFSYWRKKYLASIATGQESTTPFRKEKFIPLEVQSISSAIEIQLPNQIVVKCSDWQFDQLSKIVQLLQALPSS